jgi:hypothetical protein
MALDAHLQLMALDAEIMARTQFMRSREREWVFLADIPDCPDKKVRRIRPEFQNEYDRALSELATLQERKVELERSLQREPLYYES